MSVQDPSQFCHPSQESKSFPSFFPLPLCLMNFKKWSPKNVLYIPPSHPYSLILGATLSVSGLNHWNQPLIVSLPLASSLLILTLPSAFPRVTSRALPSMHISLCNHEAQYFPLSCRQLRVPRQTLPLTVFSVQSLHLFFAIASALPSMWKALLPAGHLGDCFTPGLSLHVPMCKAFYTHWVN